MPFLIFWGFKLWNKFRSLLAFWRKLHIVQSFNYYLRKQVFSFLCYASDAIYAFKDKLVDSSRMQIVWYRGGARGVPGGPLPPKIFRVTSSGVVLFLKVLNRPLTAPLVAKLAPPVAPPNKNVWLRPWYDINQNRIRIGYGYNFLKTR